jgi:hypothetical protein
VTSYKIVWDQGTGGAMVDWDAAYTGGTNLIVTALIPSTTYNF